MLNHKLSIYKKARPIAQKRRKLGGKKKEAPKATMQKLLKA